MPKPERRIVVTGSDASSNARLVGSLIYKCGLDILLAEQLRREGKHQFEEIPAFLDEHGHQKRFETAKHECKVVDLKDTADLRLIVVPDTTLTQSRTLEAIREQLEQSQPSGIDVIALDYSTKSDWSSGTYRDLVNGLSLSPDVKAPEHRTIITPISSLHSINILGPVKVLPWGTQDDEPQLQSRTLVQALDE